MESNQDSAALAQQVQALTAVVEELTKQNQEMKLQIQQEENRFKNNTEDEGIVTGKVVIQGLLL